jgi:hypothetical protein
VIIITAWTISFLLAIVIPTYNPPRELTPLTFIIAGWLYREAVSSRKTPSPEEDEHERQ